MLVDEIVDGFRCMYVRMSISCMCGGRNVSGYKNKEGFSVASCSVVCQEVRGKFFSSVFCYLEVSGAKTSRSHSLFLGVNCA